MIWFGTPKTVLKKDISEFDLIRFSPGNIETEKLEGSFSFEKTNGEHMFGLYYVKFNLEGVLKDSAIFEAMLYDPLYYASVLKESGHIGQIVKMYPGYIHKFRDSFIKHKESRNARYRYAKTVP